MANQEKLGFRERTGNYAIAGGVIAGLIGLFARPDLIAAGIALAAGGFILRKTGQKKNA